MAYDYTHLAQEGNPAVIFRGIVGSRAYGTANAQSDTDIRGIFTVPSREYVRLSVPPKQVSDERNDRTYWVWNPWPEEPPEPEDYCVFLSDVHQFPWPLKESGVELGRCRVTRLSKCVTADIFHVYDFGAETGGVFRGGAPVVSSIAKEDAGKRIGVLIFNKQAFDSAKRQHQEYWSWCRHRNEARWGQQERGQLDYDAKNMMHLTRLLFSGENIVKNGAPIVRFDGEKLQTLLSIRRGEWTFDAIIAHAEKIQAEIEARKGRLRPVPDRARIDELIGEVMKEAGVA